MQKIKVQTKRGVLLDGVLFPATEKTRTQPGTLNARTQTDTPNTRTKTDRPQADTLLIAITGIHGNFYSNPFYYNIGDTLNAAGIDFLYAQTNDAFGTIRTTDVHTGEEVLIGSWNERFAYTDEDIDAYLTYAEHAGYKRIILGGHSLGANKVIYYLSRHHDPRVAKFLLLSPANLDYMTASVTEREREMIRLWYEQGHGGQILPFLLMGWVQCTVATAYDWVHSGLLNNVHTAHDGDFSHVEQITHTGALLIGTYDNFTDGDPVGFLTNINSHFPAPEKNRLLFIERTGHTYQQKQQELAEKISALLQDESF